MYLDSLIEGYSSRLLMFLGGCLAFFLVLEISLWNVQLKGGEQHREEISKQSLRKVRINPVRGRIITADDEVVADTKPIFDVIVHVSEMRQPGKRINTLKFVSKKILEASAVMGRLPEALSKENLEKVFNNSFDFKQEVFSKFWNSGSALKKKYFATLSEQAAWKEISTDYTFAAGIENEKELSFRYRPLFQKIADARAMSKRLYQTLDNKSYLTKMSESWARVKQLRKQQLTETTSPETVAHIEEIISISELEFSMNSIWRMLRLSWRWRNGVFDYKYNMDIDGVADILSQQDLITILDKKYEKLVEIAVLFHISSTPALPYKAFRNLNHSELGAVSEAMHSIPGLEVQVNCRRDYKIADFASHVLGVTGKRSPEDYEEEKYYYALPELDGLSGLEYTYDSYLSGKPGRKMLQVDKLGYSHEVIDKTEAVNGCELKLNIISEAQQAAQYALEEMHRREGKNGAVVLLDCNTGAVLAMASYPTFKLPDFDYDTLIADKENKPLLNRVMSKRYTPGSIVKPLVALGALQSGAMPPDFVVNCTGFHYVDPEKKKGRTRCASWRRGGHGELDVLGAIEQSCNPFFNTIGIMTTFDVLRPYFLQAGFGSKTGVDLHGSSMIQGETSGYVPTRESKRRATRIPWNSWDTAQFSMGQADTGVTPLQAVTYVAAIANGGTVYKPFLVKSINRPDGTVEKSFQPTVKGRIEVDAAYFDLVRQGMLQVVFGDHASAKIARQAPIQLAGKTGTAQVGKGKQHTWFAAYGPFEKPSYACVAVVENGRRGGLSAAPVVVDLFKKWIGSTENN